jgi:DNA repair protein SbcD/Mre11
MKIFHAADLHLGRRRLDGRLPDKDLADAFGFIAAKAIEEKANVFLIAGDLFDHAQVEPPHLRQAQQVLVQLKKAGIPVIAIEGNHDKAFIHSEGPTWLHYLGEDDLLILLRTPFDAKGPILTPWQECQKGGAWIDVDGVRFVGAGYLGAATPHKARQIAERLEPNRAHVLLLHAGPDYFVGEAGGFSSEDLQALHERICYLALGHIHKPMKHKDWACNPGSAENCDLQEAANDTDRKGLAAARGYAVVEIDPARHEQPMSLEIRSNPRRPCHRVELDCTPFGDQPKDCGLDLIESATRLIRALKLSPAAVIDLHLAGRLDLNRIDLDHSSFCAEIEKAAGVFAVTLDVGALNANNASEAAPNADEGLLRAELEKNAIRGLVDGKKLWGLEGLEAEFAALFYELKESVRTGKSGEELAEQICQSSLVEMIQAARAGKPGPET